MFSYLIGILDRKTTAAEREHCAGRRIFLSHMPDCYSRLVAYQPGVEHNLNLSE
jgi:hypothetical protein